MAGLVVLLLVLVALAGCGGQTLTDDETLDVLEARVAVSRTVLDGSEYEQALQGIDRAISIYRAKPDAKVDVVEGDDLTMRQTLEDLASQLEPYRPGLASKIDRALGP